MSLEVLQNVVSAGRKFRELRRNGLSLGLVPTMGALHEGHLSLVRRAAKENDVVVVSVFVNPAQFDDPDDLKSYPQDFEADRMLLESAGTDLVFYPDAEAMYPDNYRYKVSENSDSLLLEGSHRQGYFDGVLTVVLKLLNIAGADRAYFGEKDWQQFGLIRGMAEAFFIDTEIVPCPLVREDDGLAMSSRNTRLTPDERKRAPAFHRILAGHGTPESKADELGKAGFHVDYVEERGDRTLAAVHLGKVRLIDNVRI
jgi:pantoate--beta-alanine ligase